MSIRAAAGRHEAVTTDRRARSWVWVAVVVVLVLGGAVLLTLVLKPPTRPGAVAEPVRAAPQVPRTASAPPSPAPQARAEPWTAAALPGEVSKALAAPTWPALHPALRTLAADGALGTACSHTSAQTLASCTFGPAHAHHVAVVLGDDVAVSWLPGIRAALEPRGWRVQALTENECPAPTIWVIAPGSTPDGDGDALTHACASHQEWAQSQIERIRPDLVIMASGANTMERLATGAQGADAQQSWQSAVVDSVNRWRAAAGDFVVLAPPPEGTDVRACSLTSPPKRCTFTVNNAWRRMAAADRASATSAPARYVDTGPWFCADQRCPAFVNGTIVRSDGVHLTAQYARLLAPLLANALLPSRN